MLLETIHLALTAIWRNALRSILTLLGVTIGVAAVIAMTLPMKVDACTKTRSIDE